MEIKYKMRNRCLYDYTLGKTVESQSYCPGDRETPEEPGFIVSEVSDITIEIFGLPEYAIGEEYTWDNYVGVEVTGRFVSAEHMSGRLYKITLKDGLCTENL